MNPKRTRAMATAFMGFPSSAQSGGSAREGHTPYHRGRGAGCANPKTTAKARGHYSKTAPTSIGTLRQMPEGVERPDCRTSGRSRRVKRHFWRDHGKNLERGTRLATTTRANLAGKMAG